MTIGHRRSRAGAFFLEDATLPNRVKSRWRRLLRWLVVSGAALFALSVLAVLLLRFVPVPFTAFMLERKLDAAFDGAAGFAG